MGIPRAGSIPATSTKWERPVTASMCIGRRALTAIFFEVLQKLCVRFDSEAPKAVTKKIMSSAVNFIESGLLDIIEHAGVAQMVEQRTK